MKARPLCLALALQALLGAALPGAALGVTCDGTELICLDLLSEAEVAASGAAVVGGDFNADGFMPNNRGGIDWLYDAGTDFSSGKFEVDVKGLVPVEAGELEGGKVSIFTFMGVAPEEIEAIELQKMAPDYRDGHIFRFGMDDDNLADNWDAVIITGSGFGCHYSINDPPWQPDQVHHFYAEWSAEGLVLEIDEFRCEKPGNGDTFNPAQKTFTLANRCQHYPNQHAVARFSNLRLWANATPPVCGNGSCEPGEDCGSCPGDCPCPEEEDVVEEEAEADAPGETAQEDASLPEPPPETLPDEIDAAQEPSPEAHGSDPDGDDGGDGDPGTGYTTRGECGCRVAL